jgi:hypothetical protein
MVYVYFDPEAQSPQWNAWFGEGYRGNDSNTRGMLKDPQPDEDEKRQ